MAVDDDYDQRLQDLRDKIFSAMQDGEQDEDLLREYEALQREAGLPVEQIDADF